MRSSSRRSTSRGATSTTWSPSAMSSIHLAAEPGVRPSWGQRFESYVRNNVLATQHLLEAAGRQPVERFVYASSSSIYGQAERVPDPRGRRPAAALALRPDQALRRAPVPSSITRTSAVPTVSLRYFSVYGPRQRPDMAFNIFCRAAIEGEPIQVFGDGRADARLHLRRRRRHRDPSRRGVPGAAGSIYNIGGGSQVSLARAIELLEEIAGTELEVAHGPPERGDVREHRGRHREGAGRARASRRRPGSGRAWAPSSSGWPRASAPSPLERLRYVEADKQRPRRSRLTAKEDHRHDVTRGRRGGCAAAVRPGGVLGKAPHHKARRSGRRRHGPRPPLQRVDIPTTPACLSAPDGRDSGWTGATSTCSISAQGSASTSVSGSDWACVR